MSIYIENGYKDRQHYLESIAEERGIPEDTVMALAHLYGPNEDFDGLVTALEDFTVE